MKKRIIIFLLILLINLSLCFININLETIRGEGVTGEITSEDVGISITITGPPTLSIISPQNNTYLTNTSISLIYSSNANNLWYNLNNNENITLTENTFFDTTQGSHTLYLYANNSYGTTSKNVSFFIDSTTFIILYDKYYSTSATSSGGGGGGGGAGYDGSETAGTSTDFASYSYEDIQNLNNIILENTQSGKILFNQAINLIDDLDPTDNIININTYINILSNRIEINSTALPNFNKQATLWFYNLTFTNPRILRDGVVCSSSICTQESYVGGELKFNVTGFSIYSAQETPAGEISPTSNGGGGSTTIKKEFSIDKEKIKISLKQGEVKKQQITIKNIGNYKLNINLESLKLQDFLKINETNFELEVGKSKTINLNFLAKKDTIPNLYTGKLIIKDNEIKKEIPIAIEIESKKALFDVKLKIPDKFLYILPGEDLLTNINILNMQEIGKVDVTLEYIIKNEQGETITSEQETRAVETELSFIKTLKIPKDAKYGTYMLYIKVLYDDKIASASSWFKINKKPFFSQKNIISIIIIFIIVVLLIILIELSILRKHIRIHGKIKEKTLINFIKKRLKK